MFTVDGKNIRNAPKFKIGDRVRVYIDWIGYQIGTIVAMNTDSIVYDWLYDVKIDRGQETSKKYTWNRCDLDIRKLED